MNLASKKSGAPAMPEENNGKTFRFDVCSQCKIVCCQDAKPPLTQQRQKIIKEYLKKQQINLEKPFIKEQYSYPVVDEHLFCVFYSKENGKCVVHSVKPETCRAGPVTFDINFETKKIEWFLKKAEICALAKALYENPDLFKGYFEAAKAEITELVCQLDAEDLRAIVKIPEPYTFKIGEDALPQEVVKKLGLK
jgi:Fe-S-cluster containining protein